MIRWFMQNWEPVFAGVAIFFFVVAKLKISWSIAAAKGLEIMRQVAFIHGNIGLQNLVNRATTPLEAAHAIEEVSGFDHQKKGAITLAAKKAGPLVAMAVQVAAAKADPKPSKRPANVVKRAIFSLLGNVALRMLPGV